jgi:riboflavin kinase / FMN adenylyltransferase
MIKTVDNITGSAIAIGNFDGFHLGHQKICDTLKRIADQQRLVSRIITFSPNPKIYFNREPFLITTDAQKKRILDDQGVDCVHVIDFASVVDMTDERFLKEVLIDEYHMKHIVMGENFRFGKRREGDIAFLKESAGRWGFQFTVVSPVMLGDVRISSSLIRQQLGESKIELSNRMLGRSFFLEGVVVEGDHVGRQLGFPTINLDSVNTILPEGVFKTRAEISGQYFDAITYIGYRPTFKGKEKKVETHLFDFERDIYGEFVRLYFEKQVRGEMKFDSTEGLVTQIKKDIAKLKVDKVAIF